MNPGIGLRCKLFVTDLDGTVLVDAGNGCFMPERTKQALGALHARGVHVVLASGRMHESIQVVAKSLGFQGAIISYNGAMVRGADGALLSHTPLDTAVSDEVLSLAEARGIPLNFYHQGKIHSRRFHPWWDLYEGRSSSPMHEEPSLLPFLGRQATKLLMMSEGSVIRGLHAELKPRFAGRANVLISSDEYLEFMSPLADKGSAVERLAAHLGIAREEIVAVGDGNNDIEMLRYAGTGLAIADGRQALIDEADHVVAGPGDHGVADFIERFLL